MSTNALLAILILMPLVGFFINGFNWRSPNYKPAGTIATLCIAIPFFAAIILWTKLLGMPAEERMIHVEFFQWIQVAGLTVPAGFVVDQISAIMILVITGVGTLIHIFSVGYMSHDKRPAKYFAYLNLFVFNMLLLVLGDNMLLMFVGWEGVGLCSYLLIGFWFTDSQKAAAGMKAFITNRVGDAGLMLGMFLLFYKFGTINFSQLAQMLPKEADVGVGLLTIACLFLFIGATGKSAQIPLYVWLPDAMAGPTPVSALIHAATMVTAGVYMITRMNGLFLLAPIALHVVAIVGVCTALFAAAIAFTQNDIKKVLAYSTVSQLGYMFLGLGVGAFHAGMFHLMTHAFFKALMFLGSGSVIHAMHEEQDIRKMGGLKKYMPITHATFFIGWLAIIGMPPFAGFFSKDEILWQALKSPLGHPALYVMGLAGAVMTAFYMTRLMALTFWGESRVPKSVHPHESPSAMTIPLIVLAILSVVGGWVGIPHALGLHIPNVWEHWLEPVVKMQEIHASQGVELSLMGVSVALAGLSALGAFYMYVKNPQLPAKVVASVGALYRGSLNKFYVDEIYQSTIIGPVVGVAKILWAWVDVNIIDKITYLLSDFVHSASRGLRATQSGNLQTYAFYIVIGIVTTLSFLLMR